MSGAATGSLATVLSLVYARLETGDINCFDLIVPRLYPAGAATTAPAPAGQP